MAEQEGVIKFNLDFEQRSIDAMDIAELNAWRDVLMRLELIGQDPARYDGYGFGNISMRCNEGFIITGTQTGDIKQLSLADYAVCTGWELSRNAVSAYGDVKPSSESLSHAAVYDGKPTSVCAFHVHSPDLWHTAEALEIPVTDASVAYGTPEMAAEVARCIEHLSLPGMFSMGGHEDGVFSFGATLAEAGAHMVEMLVRARALRAA